MYYRCVKDVKNSHGYYYFTENMKYEVIKIKEYENGRRLFLLDDNFDSHEAGDKFLKEHFISLQQERKEKIMRLLK